MADNDKGTIGTRPPEAGGRAGATGLARQAVRAAALGMFLDGFDLSIMAIALLPLRQAFHLDAASTGALMASALIGSLFGGLLGGILVDRFGRKALLLPNVALYALGAIVSAMSPTLAVLGAGRLLVGLAVGMDYPLVSTVIAEYSLKDRRGQGFAGINVAWYLGALASTLVGLALLAIGPDSWRFMLGAALLPALVLLWLRQRIPESPRWLARRGQADAARAALGRLHPEWAASTIEAAITAFTGTRQRLPVLLRGAWRRRLAASLIPWTCLDIVGLGIGLYFPLVLRMQGLAGNNTAAAEINAVFLLISTVAILFIYRRLDTWGRVPLQITGFLLMTGGLLLFALGIETHVAATVYAGSAIYSVGTGIGPGVTAMALSVEIFPTELRASAGGLATAVSRLGAVGSAVIFPRLEATFGLATVLLFMAAIALAGVGATRLCPVEPARQDLEDLEMGGH